LRPQIRQFIEKAGGPDAIRRLLFTFYERMAQDTLIGYFFAGKDLAHIADKQSEFILNAGGFLPRFEGKGPATAHVALPPIYAGHFDRRLVILREVLTESGLAPETIDQWVAFEEGFREMIVTDEPKPRKR
jgi:truncated hemoglobin YjbI